MERFTPAPGANHARLRAVAGVPLALAAVLAAGTAAGQTVTVSGTTLGRTPTRLGYNVGDFNNDNTASWWRYTGVNAGRMFTSPSTLTPSSVIKSTTNASLNASSQS